MQVDYNLAMIWLTANVLHEMWGARVMKRRPELFLIRATLDAKIKLLGKSRYSNICDIFSNIQK